MWRVAKKTKGLRAKPMITLLVDRAVMAKFLVDTLEAREPVQPDALFCIGESNDAWQQSAKKLLAKYTVDAIDSEGWMVCNPKPDNSVEFRECMDDIYITGHWGETIDGVPNQQRARFGDFILRNREDTTDQWVVARKIFINTYSEIS
jgi:hypothetical protein